MTKPSKTKRIHSLDSLRAIMMLLGVVFHSAITYTILDFGSVWGIKDPIATHYSNDMIIALIHMFRMPIFFVVAGFFGAMLFYERTPLKMLENRISRILYPFLVFLFILTPLIIFALDYSSLVFDGSDNALANTLSYFFDLSILIPKSTYHLWFLYYFIFTTAVATGLALVLKKLPFVTKRITWTFNWIIQKPILRVLFFASILSFIYIFIESSEVATSNSLIPDLKTFTFYFFFYLFGWILFKSKHLFDSLKRFDWACTILGLLAVLFKTYLVLSLNLHPFSDSWILIVLNSIAVWLFVFGITGLFIRYGSKHSLKMRYISDSSYWVYLIHLPLTILIPSFILDWPFPATVKFIIVLLSTTVICFITYHYLVRGTFIGKFLNGRKYSSKISTIKKSEELSRFKEYSINKTSYQEII